MIRKVTKASTVTPMSTLTNSKSVGQGVKNIGKGKSSKPMSMGMKKEVSAPEGGFFKNAYKQVENAMTMGSSAGIYMPKPKIARKAVKTGTIMPTQQKPKAKMLPEVKVTAPGKFKRFVSKLTSTKRG
jgi:hypothetical protein